MICPKCNFNNKEGSKFCAMCGTRQKRMLVSKETVEKAIAGDQQALTELYNNTYNTVYYVVKSIVVNEDTTMDIVQDAYMKAFTNMDKLKSPEAFVTWLKLIATNVAKDYVKKKKPLLFSEMLAPDDEDDEPQFPDMTISISPEETLDKEVKKQLLWDIINDLSEEQRITVSMFYFQQMTVVQIADNLKTSTGTIKSRLNYARKKIEAKVLDLEKQGTKLYGLAPIPFLVWLFSQNQEKNAVLPRSLPILNEFSANTQPFLENNRTNKGNTQNKAKQNNVEHSKTNQGVNKQQPQNNSQEIKKDAIASDKGTGEHSKTNSNQSNKAQDEKNMIEEGAGKKTESTDLLEPGSTKDSNLKQEKVADKYKKQAIGNKGDRNSEKTGPVSASDKKTMGVRNVNGHNPLKWLPVVTIMGLVVICGAQIAGDMGSRQTELMNNSDTTSDNETKIDINSPYSEFYTGSDVYVWEIEPSIEASNIEVIEQKGFNIDDEVNGDIFKADFKNWRGFLNGEYSIIYREDSDKTNKYVCGLIDYEGNILVEPSFKNIYAGVNETIVCENDDKSYAYTKGGKLVEYVPENHGIAAMYPNLNGEFYPYLVYDKRYGLGFGLCVEDVFGINAVFPDEDIAHKSGVGYTIAVTFLEEHMIAIGEQEDYTSYDENLKATLRGVPITSILPTLLKEGVPVVPTGEYKYIGSCGDGLYAVERYDKWGYINSDGNVVIPIEYDGAWIQNFNSKSSWQLKIAYPASDGYIVLYKENGYALYDTQGNEVIPFLKFAKICPVHDGKAWVQDMRTGLWGLLRINSLN